MSDSHTALIQQDRDLLWHPYSAFPATPAPYLVDRAKGVELFLRSGETLIDGMASWWSIIHGYSNPVLNEAIREQVEKVSHVMFGGLTHEPAIKLARKLSSITPGDLKCCFFVDSGSVAVEVALKMALQYWGAVGAPDKSRILSFRNGYHGDTLGAMSVSDPDTGMHAIYSQYVPRQLRSSAPPPGFSSDLDQASVNELRTLLDTHHKSVAAIIIEPIVQGAGGMRFYCPAFLKQVRRLCTEYDVLLIADEIATGFGRTGSMFACNHAGITPDILCLGKAISGGYLSFAVTMTTAKIAQTISSHPIAGAFMHGPTFMGNPLACSVSLASIELLECIDWLTRVANIQTQLFEELTPLEKLSGVADVRVLGAIGVVETHSPLDMESVQNVLIRHGVWLRPFGKLLYTMPPFISEREHISTIAKGMQAALSASK